MLLTITEIPPFGAWRHHLSPRFAVGLWVLGRGVNLHVEQQRRETVQPGLWPVGNAPLLVLTPHLSPGGGTLLYASLCANLSCSLHSAARISPSGGDAAAGGRRGAFPSRRRRGLPVFPPPARAAPRFYQKRRLFSLRAPPSFTIHHLPFS